MRAISYASVVVVLALLVAATGFAVDPGGGEELSPVRFDETLQTGMTGVDIQQAETAGYAVPRGQVFYSQYQYVVGFWGLDSLAGGVTADRYVGQFGQPLAVFVTDYAGTDPTLTDENYVTLSNSIQRGWVRAEDAYFVVDTPARTPAGQTPVPFGEESAARTFASEHGGTVLDWRELKDRLASQNQTRSLTPPTEKRMAWANTTVEQSRQIRDRQVSVTVGDEEPTLARAVENATANSTVRIPPGRYDANLTIDKPLTLRGAGNDTVLDGGDTGTTITATAPGVAVTDLRISGVGDVDISEAQDDDGSEWDQHIRLVYAYGDAAVRLADAPDSRIENVTIETPANGVVALNSSGTVVRNATILGSDEWEDGFMGVLPMYSRMVIEDSSFVGGRDAVYTHYADGTVVRDNHMQGMRYGVHTMYTSDTLAIDNTMRDTLSGVILMTRPTGNAIVGNDVRNSEMGISTVGTSSYVTENVLVDNGIGLSIGTTRSVYRYNTVVRNDVGVRTSTLLPTNDVFENDVVDNETPASMTVGTLNSWSAGERGNYWGVIPGADRDGDGVLERPYRPTDAIDRSARSTAGGYALAHAPTLGAVRQFQRAVPGLRSSTVVDPAPLTEPVRPDRLDRLNVSTP